MSLRLCLLGSTLVLSQLCFSQTQSAPPQLSGDLPCKTPHVELPFKLYGNYLIVVQGSLGARERLNFLIDTGVNPTAIDRRIAENLGLTGEVHTLALLNQNTTVEQVVLPRLQVGPIRAESLPGIVEDLSPLKEALAVQIDAVVGLDVLSLSSFGIDYRTKKIVFGPIESSPSAVPFDTGPPIVTVQLRLSDEPVRLLVDTGAAELVLFECQLHGHLRQLPISGDLRRLSNSRGTESGLTEVWLRGVRLGATDFGLQKALSADSNANCGRSFDGVLGATRLGLKWIAFDFEHQTFSWKR